MSKWLFGWEVRKLGDVCFFQRGLTYKKKDEVEKSRNGVLRANNISLENGILNFDEIKYIDDKIEVPKKKFVKKNSLLICNASGSKKHLGKVAFVDKDYNYAFGGFMGLITPKKNLNPKFLYWLMRSKEFFEFIGHLADGVNINNLKFSQLSEFEIPIPSLPEQKRIVAILDEAFAGIERAVANTEKNLANARELFDGYLNFVFTKRGKEWRKKTLGELCNFLNGFAFKSKDAVKSSNVQLIRMGNLYKNILDLDRKPSFYPEEIARENSRYVLSEGDLIISLTGTTGKKDYGYAVEIPPTNRILLLNQRIAKFDNINKELINKRYLLHYLRSRVFLDNLYRSAHGVRQANLSSVSMKKLPVVFPKIDEQKILIEKFDAIENDVKSLESIYQQKLTALAELKQSLLQKAFSGELTAEKADNETQRAVA